MRQNFLFLCILAMLSAASGYLMSKASWIGRVGISLFHKEFNLLKIWWEGASAVFIVLIILFLLHAFVQARLHIVAARVLHVVLLLAAIGGAYLTYLDFTNDFSHHLMGWRFHLGFYLFWAGWVLMCLFFLTKRKPRKLFPTDPNSMAKAS